MAATFSRVGVDSRVHGGNHYRRLEEIGRGGFGVIHTVRGVDDRVYVEKQVSRKDPRIASEVQTLSRMQACKGVVKLYDVYEDQDHVYMIMEKGWKDISATHAMTYNTCTEKDAKKIIAQALKVLAQGHAQGIVHLDVKGGNFLWKDENEAQLMVIDWGLSLELPKGQPYVDQKDFSGTPWFMAPEQLRSEATDKSDVWAVGVLACQLLTGTMPFNDKVKPHNPSVAAIWKSILMDDVDFTKSAWKNVSENAKDFVRQVLQKDPNQRPNAISILQHPWLWEVVKEYDVQESRKARFSWYGRILGECMNRVAKVCATNGVDLSSTPGEDLRNNPLIIAEVQSLFMSLDMDSDGRINLQDLREILKGIECMPWEEKAEIERVHYMMNGDSLTLTDFQTLLLGKPLVPTYLFG